MLTTRLLWGWERHPASHPSQGHDMAMVKGHTHVHTHGFEKQELKGRNTEKEGEWQREKDKIRA